MFRITQQSLQALGCLIIFFIKFQNLIFSKRCGFIILFILEIFQQLLKVFLFGRKFLLILPSPPKYQSKVYVPFGYASVNRFTVPVGFPSVSTSSTQSSAVTSAIDPMQAIPSGAVDEAFTAIVTEGFTVKGECNKQGSLKLIVGTSIKFQSSSYADLAT